MEWQRKPLSELCTLRRELEQPSSHSKNRYVGLEHIDPGKTRIARWGMDNEVRSTKSRFHRNDVLYGKLRPYLDKAALANWDGVCSTDILTLAPKSKEVLPEYLVLLLHTKDFHSHAIATTTGVNLPRTSWKDIGSFLIEIPSLPEQQAIAGVLSKIQRAVELEEKRIAALKELKAATMAKVFREGLRGERLKKTEIGEVPESWGIVPLRECALIQTGVTKGRVIPDGEGVEVPYLRVANVQDGYLDLKVIKTIRIRPAEIERFLLKAGDVVLTEGGDFDKLGRGFIWRGEITGCVHQNHIFAVRVDQKRLVSEFFAYQAQSPYGKRYFLTVAHKTTNLACINATKLGGFPTLIPSKREQEEIASLLGEIDGRIRIAERRLSAAGGLISSALHKLMTGKLRVAPVSDEVFDG